MATELVTVLNPATGQVGEISRRLFRIPSIGGSLVEVEPGTKSYDPDLYAPKTPEEFIEARPKKVVKSEPVKPAIDDQTKKDDD